MNTAVTYSLKKLGYCSHLDKFYTHAKDVPYWNWAQLHDYDNENISLLVKPNYKSNNKKAFEKAYKLITRSIIDVHGYPEDYIKKVNALADIRLKELEYWSTGDRIYINDINVAKAQNKLILEEDDGQKVTMWDSFNSVQKIYVAMIDPKEWSVLRFYELRARLVKENKEHQEEIRRSQERKRQGVY